ncbi:MAG TPA: glycosyltransferase family 2 protein [Candidatus Saccharimonadales bacterium]|nr:glycosyltransferase family 2 protein [Candidatus Saccharimonadales bacterium]
MSRTLQIVLPMVGLGSRFANAGFATPKPLIEVDGMPMFRKALSSLEDIKAKKRYVFVIRQEHVDTQKLDTLITKALPEAEIVVVLEVTRGAAESVLAAKPKLNAQDALISLDCDLWFESASYYKMVQDSLTGVSDIDGGVLTFPSNDPKYSYAAVDEKGMVTRTAEKQVISNSATTGAYFFAKAGTFTTHAEALLAKPLSETMKEYYISFVYGLLLADGGKVQAATVNKFASFGTPEELDAYNNGTQTFTLG